MVRVKEKTQLCCARYWKGVWFYFRVFSGRDDLNTTKAKVLGTLGEKNSVNSYYTSLSPFNLITHNLMSL